MWFSKASRFRSARKALQKLVAQLSDSSLDVQEKAASGIWDATGALAEKSRAAAGNVSREEIYGAFTDMRNALLHVYDKGIVSEINVVSRMTEMGRMLPGMWAGRKVVHDFCEGVITNEKVGDVSSLIFELVSSYEVFLQSFDTGSSVRDEAWQEIQKLCESALDKRMLTPREVLDLVPKMQESILDFSDVELAQLTPFFNVVVNKAKNSPDFGDDTEHVIRIAGRIHKIFNECVDPESGAGYQDDHILVGKREIGDAFPVAVRLPHSALIVVFDAVSMPRGTVGSVREWIDRTYLGKSDPGRMGMRMHAFVEEAISHFAVENGHRHS